LSRDPKGRVQDVTPVKGLPAEPLPVPPVQVGEPAAIWNRNDANAPAPELTLPPEAWTVSVNPLTVTVSCASSSVLRIEYEHVEGAPLCVGLTHPFVKASPCCTGSPGAANAIVTAVP